MDRPLTLLVSLDGIAPRGVTTELMPRLTGLAREGAACWSAQTVTPSITLPAHTSLLRGVDPSVHQIFDNTPIEPQGSAPSILRVARDHDLTTAAVYAWTNMHPTLEVDATDERVVFDSGYDLTDDDRVTETALGMIASGRIDVLYVYLAAADLVGHDHGWLSDPYLETLAGLDRHVGRLLDAAGADATVLITTDHGGLGNDHQTSRPEDLETFVAARAPGVIAPASLWNTASILDVAPTLAALLDVPAALAWQGQSLIGTERSTVEVLLDQLASMAHHHYGETVNMLDHSLQTAALARSEGASDALLLAALVHDIGHLGGNAGAWGLPTHANVGARYLQQLVPATVYEPVRNHVDAKRYLVTTDAQYAGLLSEASTVSLGQQGGPFTAIEAEAFAARPGASDATQLRRWDDAGKVDGLDIAPLDSYRDLIAHFVGPAAGVSGTWARDACRCPECRDAINDQHLIDIADLDGWTITASDGPTITVQHTDGHTHTCHTSPTFHRGSEHLGSEHLGSEHLGSEHLGSEHLGSEHLHGAWAGYDWERRAVGDRQIAVDVDRFGIAMISDVACEPGEVLQVAASLGFVRSTNYGDLFDVVTEQSPKNLAYSSLGLPLHTDNPYRDPCPTVQLLHCLTPADDGGASKFSDGFAAAEQLRTLDPAAFEALTTTPLTFRFHDDTVDLQAQRTMIELDPHGAVKAISVNHRSMETPPPGPITDRFYTAYRTFRDLLSSADAIVEVTLLPGELVVFDNRRVLHGRTAFSTTSRRHLQGCYIDIDAVRSTARLAG